MYDPLLGRFLSPDPFVQMPDFSQNFNRYSYRLNNPLVYVDEDGEFFLTIICALVPGL
jgi:RHS repeat-associated protein